mgnify:FL=1
MKDFLSAVVLIFVAEMGDKTQLLAFALSTQYHYRTVLIGVLLGAFLNHGLAILFAHIVSKFSSMQYLQMVSSILFIVFGLISLNTDKKPDEEGACYRSTNFGIIATIAMCFFVGELGDKTQLTAMTLGLRTIHPILTLLGSSIGMVLVSSVGILAGKTFSSRINSSCISLLSSGIFLIFGLGSIIKLYVSDILGKEVTFLIVGITVFTVLFFLYREYRRKNMGCEDNHVIK